MLGRVIRKLVVATSVLASLLLALLTWRTQQNDLLTSWAKSGNYNELRLGDGQVALTVMTQWPPDDKQLGWGRPAATWVSKLLVGYDRLNPQAGRRIRMLDGAVVRLEPGTSSKWWSPVARSDGRALVDVPTARHMHPGSASRPTTTFSLALSKPYLPPPELKNMKITVPSPSFGLGGSPADGTASRLLSAPEFQRDQSLSLNVLPKPAPPQPMNLAFGSTRWVSPIYRYERYAVSAWIVILIVLVPLWWSLLRSLVRWRQRRVRRRRGLCEQCGYDLRGNPAGNACPECGTPPTPDEPEAAEASIA